VVNQEFPFYGVSYFIVAYCVCDTAMFIQLSEVMYYALLEPDMDFIFKERGQFNVKAS